MNHKDRNAHSILRSQARYNREDSKTSRIAREALRDYRRAKATLTRAKVREWLREAGMCLLACVLVVVGMLLTFYGTSWYACSVNGFC